MNHADRCQPSLRTRLIVTRRVRVNSDAVVLPPARCHPLPTVQRRPIIDDFVVPSPLASRSRTSTVGDFTPRSIWLM